MSDFEVDKNFRKRINESCRKYQKRLWDEGKSWKQLHPEEYNQQQKEYRRRIKEERS